jgi:hypothetical protein
MRIVLAVCKTAHVKVCTVSHLINNNQKTCDERFIYRKMILNILKIVQLAGIKDKRPQQRPYYPEKSNGIT